MSEHNIKVGDSVKVKIAAFLCDGEVKRVEGDKITVKMARSGKEIVRSTKAVNKA